MTGSKGFIGSHLLSCLELEGHEVYGWSLEGIYCGNKRISSCNMLEYDEVLKIIRELNPDLVYHCAGSADVSYSVYHPYDDLVSNYITTHNLVFAIKESGLLNIKFILLSSAAVYGNPICLPMMEEAPIIPLSPYALHKRAAEEVCLFALSNFGIKCRILRLFSVYGPGLRKQIFWDMFQKIKNYNSLSLLGSGEESRDYIFIDDLIEVLKLVGTIDCEHNVFNVGNGREITIRKVAEVFALKMGLDTERVLFTGKRREGDPINWCADISKIECIGYKQSVSFEDGVQRYIDWANTL